MAASSRGRLYVAGACSDPDQRSSQADHQGHLRPEHRPAQRAHLRRQQERPHRHLDRHGRHPAAPRPHRSQRGRQARSLGVLRREGPAREGRLLPSGRREARCVGVCGPDGKVVRIEISSAKDETKIDRWERYEPKGASPEGVGALLAADEDTNHDGKRDKWETYDGGRAEDGGLRRGSRRPARSAADLCRRDVDADREPA